MPSVFKIVVYLWIKEQEQMIKHHKNPVFVRETNLQLKYLYQIHPTDTKIVKLFAWKFVNMNPYGCKGGF
jgi:hypothetical protein